MAASSKYVPTTSSTQLHEQYHYQRRLPPQLLQVSADSRHRHVLTSGDELHAQLQAQQPGSGARVLVIPSLDEETVAILTMAAGVDPAFIEAHTSRVVYRPRGPRRTSRWWSWRYPVLGKKQPGATRAERQKMEPPMFNLGGGCDSSVCLHRASLWLSGPVPILILEPPAQRLPSLPPSVYSQDSATAPVHKHRAFTETEARSLADALLDRMEDGMAAEDAVGQVVHESWLSFVDGLSPRTKWEGRKDQGLLWMVLRALEYNIDVARERARRGEVLGSVDAGDWTDLMDRIQRRVHLYSLCVSSTTATAMAQPRTGAGPDASPPPIQKGANERSLDRIAYLGGLLLPVTVVSGVLSIEGVYGPEGSDFWVFWTASVVVSAVALLVIYLDQVRSLHVWIEVAASELLLSDSDSEEVEDEGEEEGPILRGRRRRGEAGARTGCRGVVMGGRGRAGSSDGAVR
ncbi:hypothetical protein B0I35DRAFT_481620 [Stachybotrys elegans]|uniref:Uncharacterized protein n=1 Tax=Stachybotrys elegans TaxID=80388 RepID=A0A8K0SLT5_9HYPO|nr:hypothetical protein B0I35DRAFT_481620 [Stachybotrys elegans]